MLPVVLSLLWGPRLTVGRKKMHVYALRCIALWRGEKIYKKKVDGRKRICLIYRIGWQYVARKP